VLGVVRHVHEDARLPGSLPQPPICRRIVGGRHNDAHADHVCGIHYAPVVASNIGQKGGHLIGDVGRHEMDARAGTDESDDLFRRHLPPTDEKDASSPQPYELYRITQLFLQTPENRWQ
jgi:hypothetical protein